MNRNAYSLVEVLFAMSILSIVSLLGFVALRTSTEASMMTQAKDEAQAALRDVMHVLGEELSTAYSERTVDGEPPTAPEDVEAPAFSEDAATLTFQVPAMTGDGRFVEGSLPITYTLFNEDAPGETGAGNGLLDDGEDLNEDGALTRQVQRTQGDEVTVVAAANCIDTLQFVPVAPAAAGDPVTSIQVRLTASKRYGLGERKVVRAELEGTISLGN